MKKNIIICSDGTGNTAVKNRGTNVFKLFEAIEQIQSTPQQISIYDDGVGSGTSKFSQVFGGAFGYGLSRNVKQLYTSLVRNYSADDNIYLFGFSRGAFTVRTLAGLVAKMGIIDRQKCQTDQELKELVEHTYRQYRWGQRALLERILGFLFIRPKQFILSRFTNRKYLTQSSELRKKFISTTLSDEKLIHFIGVWDTVSAVGFPIPWVTYVFNKLIYRFSFSDNILPQKVKQAYQALSIDEQRKTFSPELWDQKDQADKNRINQIWFAGVHSNIGGGYPKQGMSLITLHWMMQKAENAGVKFITHDLELFNNKQNVHDKLYDSRKGLSIYYRFKPRNIYRLCQTHHVKAKIHSSAINRIFQGTDGYSPGNLPIDFEINDVQKHPCYFKDASQLMSKLLNQLGNKSSFLKTVVFWYAIRKFSHGVFFIVTLLALFDFYNNNKKLVEETAISELPTEFIKYALFNQEINMSTLMLIVGMLFYFVILYSKNKMKNKYSSFWHKLIALDQ